MSRNRSPNQLTSSKLKEANYYIRNTAGRFWNKEESRYVLKEYGTLYNEEEAAKVDVMPVGGHWYAPYNGKKKKQVRNSERQTIYYSLHWITQGNNQEDYGIFYADTKGEIASVIQEACQFYGMTKRIYYTSAIPNDFTAIAAGERIGQVYDVTCHVDRRIAVKILAEREFELLTAACGF